MNTESWCQVEGSSNQQWTRSTRRHNPQAFQSKVFGRDGPDSSEGRVDWDMGNRPARQKLAQRKHFPEKCECVQLALSLRKMNILYTDISLCTDETTLK